MNITMFIGSLDIGGAERVISNLSNYFSQKDNVTIITMSCKLPSYHLSEKVRYVPLEREPISKLFLIKNLKRILNLNKIIKQEKQDIYLVFLPITSFILLALRKKIKVPIIVSVRNDPKAEYSSKLKYFLMKKLYPHANGFIFQTKEAMDYFDDKIKNKSIIVPNPINEEFIQKPFIGRRRKIIVSAGRLSQQKNHILLINAFSKINLKYSDFKLIIYGEGSLRSLLEKKIRELNLQDKIELPGYVENIKEYIFNAALFVLSSDFEGMPNALMEAMALGLPVISTDCPCGGPRFLIQNETNGILVPVNDVNAMVKAIDMVLTNKDFSCKISEQAAKITEYLNPHKVYKQWEDYIKIYVCNTRKLD